jgi:hypothetical protein
MMGAIVMIKRIWDHSDPGWTGVGVIAGIETTEQCWQGRMIENKVASPQKSGQPVRIHLARLGESMTK